MLGEPDNHYITEISTLISRWCYTHIYPYHHFSQVSGGGVDRCSFAFLKIVAQHHQHLLSFLISHGKIITFRTKINYLIIKICFFFKERPLRMGISERMDTLIYYKCEHFATVCLHSMVALGMEIF